MRIKSQLFGFLWACVFPYRSEHAVEHRRVDLGHVLHGLLLGLLGGLLGRVGGGTRLGPLTARITGSQTIAISISISISISILDVLGCSELEPNWGQPSALPDHRQFQFQFHFQLKCKYFYCNWKLLAMRK